MNLLKQLIISSIIIGGPFLMAEDAMTQDIDPKVVLIQSFYDVMLDENVPGPHDHILNDDITLYGPATGQIVKGVENIRQLDFSYSKAFTKKEVKIHHIFAHEDKVVVIWTLYGTHKGDYEGIHKSGKDVVVSGQSMFRFKKDRISEIWQSWDRLALLEQIGDVQVSPTVGDAESNYDFLKAMGLEMYYEKAFLLSKRERECLKYLTQGNTAKDTAAALAISYRTVESYFENIKNKLGCQTKRDLFTIAQALDKLRML